MIETTKISKRYKSAEDEREAALEPARIAVALTKPQLLRELDQNKDDELYNAYQSVGANGVSSVSGKTFNTTFPIDLPWFGLDLTPSMKYSDTLTTEQKQVILQELFITEVTAVATLTSSRMARKEGQQTYNFRTQQYRTILQAIGTGDALQLLTDDYRIKLFPRHNYVTHRDSTGTILFHITKETIDPLELTPDQLAAIDLDSEVLLDQNPDERMEDIYTIVEWQPVAKNWVIKQEANGHMLPTKGGHEAVEEDISPYFSIPFDLSGGDNYGRGLPELNIGDLRTLNESELRLLKLLNLASMPRPVIDPTSGIQPDTITNGKGGEPISAEVVGGKPTGIGWFAYGQVADYRMLTDAITRKTMQLSKSFMNDSEALPTGERVTREQILRVGNDLDATFGGLFTFMAEGLQIPLIHRTLHQLRRDNLIKPLTDQHYRIVTQTGIAAIADQNKFRQTMEFVQMMGQLGPGVIDKIDMDVLIKAMARQARITEPGIIKSQVQQEEEAEAREEAIERQQQSQKTTDVIGNIAEEQAKQQLAPPQQA